MTAEDLDRWLRCPTCPHKLYAHGPGNPCGGVDAAGDVCGCEHLFRPAYLGGRETRVSKAKTQRRNKEMYIAVVCKGKNLQASNRAYGDWASFISHSKTVAIERAMQANERWGNKYTVLVGELAEVVRPRRDYYLRSL